MASKAAYDDVAIVKAIEQMALDGTLRGGRKSYLTVKLDFLRRKLERIGIPVTVQFIGTLLEDIGVERQWSRSGRVGIDHLETLARAGRFTQYCEELSAERARAPVIRMQMPWDTHPDTQGPYSDAYPTLEPPPETVARFSGESMA